MTTTTEEGLSVPASSSGKLPAASRSPASVGDLPAHLILDAAFVIADAFREESLSRLAANLDDSRVRIAFARVFATVIRAHIESGHPVRAVIENDRVLGVAALRSPHLKLNRWQLIVDLARRLPSMIRALRYMERGAIAAGRAARPLAGIPEPHYALEIIAVAPSWQGRGIARRLLDDVHGLVDGDARAAGCYLVTADERPRQIYEKQGYAVIDTRTTGHLTVYHMFRFAEHHR
jgi:GNAT superfamily N-acetyltransferase